MTRVCLVGEDDVELRYELLTHETAREVLETYDLAAPFENTVAVETISLGGAVSFLNDLEWYRRRFVEDALVLEPSISEEEWLSRDLALAVRDDELDPDETGRLLKVYGVEAADDCRRLVEPMYVARTGPELPAYDLREVLDTLVVRVTEAEFGG